MLTKINGSDFPFGLSKLAQKTKTKKKKPNYIISAFFLRLLQIREDLRADASLVSKPYAPNTINGSDQAFDNLKSTETRSSL